MKAVSLAALSLLLAARAAGGELPVVEGAAWGPLRDHCRQLIQGLEARKQPLPADTMRALRALLEEEPKDPEAAALAVQKLLDPHCLLGVNINPESRVKAARGPAAAELQRGESRLVLVKVHNDAGVTHALAVRGPGLVGEGLEGGRWLEAAFVTEAPFGKKLSGSRVEYRLLRLRALEVGKREATFQLDVGQGTQDLGFRAEVPVLFTVRDR
jgi:hypothetical protein